MLLAFLLKVTSLNHIYLIQTKVLRINVRPLRHRLSLTLLKPEGKILQCMNQDGSVSIKKRQNYCYYAMNQQNVERLPFWLGVTFSVADLGFPTGGCANPGGAPTYYLTNFSRKLHENEEILVQRWGRASLAPPLRSASDFGLNNIPVHNMGFSQGITQDLSGYVL